MFFSIINLGEEHEICIDRHGARCDGDLRLACFSAESGDQPRLLRAVLPERKLPELWTGKSLYGQLPEPKLAKWLRSYGWLPCSPVPSRTPQALLTQKRPSTGGPFEKMARTYCPTPTVCCGRPTVTGTHW